MQQNTTGEYVNKQHAHGSCSRVSVLAGTMTHTQKHPHPHFYSYARTKIHTHTHVGDNLIFLALHTPACCDVLASCCLTHLAAFSAKRTPPEIFYDEPATRPKLTCRRKTYTHTCTHLATLLEHLQSQNKVCLKKRGEKRG